MEKKSMMAILAVAIIAIVAIGAYVLLSGDNGSENTVPTEKIEAIKTIPDDMARLNVLGNANMDDAIDSKDVDFIKKVLNKKETNNFYCDANRDGYVDSGDINFINSMISGDVTKIYYVDVQNDVEDVTVPINNLAVGFRRTNEMVAILGCTDMIVGATNGGLQQYAYIGFSDTAKKNIINPGQNNDGNVSSETLLALYKEYSSKGGLTILGDANGMDKNIESITEGTSMDVVRLGCTESDRYDDGMVTLAYLLSFNKDHASAVKSGIDWWLGWNDKNVKIIKDAVAKLSTEEKSIVVLSVAGSPNVNLRGESTAEQVLASASGVDYLYKYAEKYGTLDNEAILAMQKEGMSKLVVEANNLYKFINDAYSKATTDSEKKAALNIIVDRAEDLMNRDTVQGYSGEYYFLPQEMCCGAEIPMYRMYIASIFVPGLADTFTDEFITQQLHDFFYRINPETPLLDAKVLYNTQ